MKKLSLVLVAVVLMSSAAFAQLSGGVRAGVNLSNQSYKSDDLGLDESGDMKAGLMIGLYLVGNLSDNIAIQPELVYSSMGANDDAGDLKMSYISIPVLLRYNFNEMINLHVGPQFGILASAEDEDGEDLKDLYNGLDIGAALGLGLDFGKFNAGARYYFSLGNAADSDAIGIDDFKAKNSAIQLFVGYKLFGE